MSAFSCNSHHVCRRRTNAVPASAFTSPINRARKSPFSSETAEEAMYREQAVYSLSIRFSQSLKRQGGGAGDMEEQADGLDACSDDGEKIDTKDRTYSRYYKTTSAKRSAQGPRKPSPSTSGSSTHQRSAMISSSTLSSSVLMLETAPHKAPKLATEHRQQLGSDMSPNAMFALEMALLAPKIEQHLDRHGRVPRALRPHLAVCDDCQARALCTHNPNRLMWHRDMPVSELLSNRCEICGGLNDTKDAEEERLMLISQGKPAAKQPASASKSYLCKICLLGFSRGDRLIAHSQVGLLYDWAYIFLECFYISVVCVLLLSQ